MKAISLRSTYQLKVTLLATASPVWRRIRLASTDKLTKVHNTLQLAMGWNNSQLHEFIKGYDHYGPPSDDFPYHFQDETKFRLDQLLKKPNDKLIYLYDYADGWEHEVILEKILPFDLSTRLPVCIDGARACPPENVGGIPGFDFFLEAISNDSHPEHSDMVEWVGSGFHRDHFDLFLTNDLLREYCD